MLKENVCVVLARSVDRSKSDLRPCRGAQLDVVHNCIHFWIRMLMERAPAFIYEFSLILSIVTDRTPVDPLHVFPIHSA